MKMNLVDVYNLPIKTHLYALLRRFFQMKLKAPKLSS